VSTSDGADRELAGGVEYVWQTIPRLPSSASLRRAEVILDTREVFPTRLYLNRTLTVGLPSTPHEEQLAHAACGFHDFRPYGASKSKVYTWWLRAKPGAGEPEDILRRRSGEAVAAIRYLDAAGHIARHDPARVLREVAAKRKIVAWHSSQHNVGGTVWDPAAQFCSTCGDQCTHVGEARCEACGYDDGCPTVLLLASVYDDHPDYEQAWRME
jgi:hypothetical protein